MRKSQKPCKGAVKDPVDFLFIWNWYKGHFADFPELRGLQELIVVDRAGGRRDRRVALLPLLVAVNPDAVQSLFEVVDVIVEEKLRFMLHCGRCRPPGGQLNRAFDISKEY